jgi:hypothetical protein
MSYLLVAGNLLVIALGFLVSYQSYRGYRRNDSTPMLYLSIGFLLLSVGGVLDCSLFSALHVVVPFASYVKTGLVATGMVTISYSLYM